MNNPSNVITLPAGADFSANASRGLIVAIGANGQVTVNGTLRVGSIATAASSPDVGSPVAIQTKGVFTAQTGNAAGTTAGNSVTVNATGKVVNKSSAAAADDQFIALETVAGVDNPVQVLQRF